MINGTINPPSPEAFLTSPTDPAEDSDLAELTPLESIADSLQRLVDVMGQPASAVLEASPSPSFGVSEAEWDELAKSYDTLRAQHGELQREHADLEAKHQALDGLVDEVLAVVKPSVSKVANQVRQTIGDWREGHVKVPSEVPEVVVEDPDGAEPMLCGALGVDVGPCGRPEGHAGWHEEDPTTQSPTWEAALPEGASDAEKWEAACPPGPDAIALFLELDVATKLGTTLLAQAAVVDDALTVPQEWAEDEAEEPPPE